MMEELIYTQLLIQLWETNHKEFRSFISTQKIDKIITCREIYIFNYCSLSENLVLAHFLHQTLN
jgi:hypothetical protein